MPTATHPARHVSLAIERPPHEVYAFASDPRNLPLWAKGLSGSVANVAGEWVAESPLGTVKVRFVSRNGLGVLDHDVVMLASGATFHNPMRVVPNATGARSSSGPASEARIRGLRRRVQSARASWTRRAAWPRGSSGTGATPTSTCRISPGRGCCARASGVTPRRAPARPSSRTRVRPDDAPSSESADLVHLRPELGLGRRREGWPLCARLTWPKVSNRASCGAYARGFDTPPGRQYLGNRLVNIEGAAGHVRGSLLVIVNGPSRAVPAVVTHARSLLVVDDDAAIREIIQAVLEVEGYAVFTAAEGAEAIERLRAGLRPGLILLDLRMPGMDGRAFRDVQAAEPDLAAVPVVILSGDGDAPRVAGSLGLEWLLKPVDLDHLLAVVARHCGRRGEPATGGIENPSRGVSR